MRAEAGLPKQSKRIRLHHKSHTPASGLLQICRKSGKTQPRRAAEPLVCRFNSHCSVPSFVSGNIASAPPAAGESPASPARAGTGGTTGARGVLAKQLMDKSSWPAFGAFGAQGRIGSRRTAAMKPCLLNAGSCSVSLSQQTLHECF